MKKDKKILLKFIALIIVCAILGGVLGALLIKVEDINIAMFLEENFNKFGPYLYYVVALFSVVFYFIILSKIKKQLEIVKNSDDDNFSREYEKLDNYLSSLTVSNSLSYAVIFGLFTAYLINLTNNDSLYTLVNMIVMLVIFVFFMILTIRVSSKLMKTTKEIDPEKRGNVLDFKFLDEYLKSCDEKEKLEIYKAGFEAYRKMSTAIPIILVVIFFIGMTIKSGILAIFSVTILWCILIISYVRGAKKSKENSWN